MPLGSWERRPLPRQLTPHASEWDGANARLAGNHPLFDSRFVDCLLKHFGRGDEELLHHTDANGQIDGLCILREHRPGIWATFLPAQTQVAPLLAAPDCDLYGIFRTLPRRVGQLDILCQDTDFTPLPAGISRPGYSKRHALTTSIRLEGDFETYWHGRSKNLTANLRRYRNRVEKAGLALHLVRITAPQEMGTAVARYGELESAGWKAQEGTAVAADNRQGVFYAELMERFAETGHACVYELWLDDRLAASRLTIDNGQMLVILKTAFDERLAEFAPGRLLLQELIQDCFQRMPGGRIEFYTQATHDQITWATDTRPIDHHTLFRSKFIDLAAQTLRALAQSRRHFGAGGAESLAPGNFTIHRSTKPDGLAPFFDPLFFEAEKQSFDFGMAWFRNFCATVRDPGTKTAFYGGTLDDNPVVALPLRFHRSRFATRGEGLTNYYSSLYAPLLDERAGSRELKHLLRAVANDFQPLAELRFAPLAPDAAPTIALRNALRAAGWFSFSYFCFGNWYLPVTGSWEEHLKKLSGEIRSTLKRMGRKFVADTGRLEIITAPPDMDRAIAAFQAVYAASWKVPEPYPEFIPGLIRLLADSGRLRLGIAWLGETPIAAQIWIVNHGKASIYKLAYHEHYSGYSPGTLLSARLLQHVIDVDRVREVDYLIGDDTYKQSWMTHRRERWGLVAYNPRNLSGLLGLLRESLFRFSKWLAARPASSPKG